MSAYSLHVCYAFMLGADSSLFRTNDDGEPSSTAGKPILGQIVKNELTNILIIVVRYFGGVKLGTSGLLVAYKTAAADAIDHAETVTCQVAEEVVFNFPYVMMNDVMRIVKEMKPRIVSQNFDNICQITLSIRKSEAEQLRTRLDKLAAKIQGFANRNKILFLACFPRITVEQFLERIIRSDTRFHHFGKHVRLGMFRCDFQQTADMVCHQLTDIFR